MSPIGCMKEFYASMIPISGSDEPKAGLDRKQHQLDIQSIPIGEPQLCLFVLFHCMAQRCCLSIIQVKSEKCDVLAVCRCFHPRYEHTF